MTYEYDLNNFISTPSIGDRRLFIYNRYNEYVESITSDISHYFVKNNCLIIKITNKNDLILSFENRDIAQLSLEKLSLYRKTLISNLSGTSDGVLNNPALTTITGDTNFVIDFDNRYTIKLYLYSNTNFTTTNLSSTESIVISILIENSGITSIDLTFPSEWLWIGYKPTQIGSSVKSVLTVQNFGSSNSDVISSYVILTNGE